MKISNNALNFLLAQYRAIFKRAYVKGLASAVILTAGLAAGAAQAAPTDALLDKDDFTNTSTVKAPITITSNSELDMKEVTVDVDGWGYLNQTTIDGADVSITGSTDHHIAVVGNMTIQNGGSLTLTNKSSQANTHIWAGTNAISAPIKITGSGSSLTANATAVNFGEVNIEKGASVTLGGLVGLDYDRTNKTSKSGEWAFYTNLYAVGSTNGTVTVSDSTVNLNSESMLGADKSITVSGDSTINFDGEMHPLGKYTENGESKDIPGQDYATAFLRGTASTNGSVVISASTKEVNGKTQIVDTPELNVAASAAGAIYANKIDINEANINIGSGGTFILDGDWVSKELKNEGTHNAATVTLKDVKFTNSGTLVLGNSQSGGRTNITGKTEILGDLDNYDNLYIYAGNHEGADGHLVISADQLVQQRDESGAIIRNGVWTGKNVGIYLKGENDKEAVLELVGTDTDGLDLNKDVQFVSQNEVVDPDTFFYADQIDITGKARIKGEHLVLNNTLALRNDANLTLEGDVLELGSNTFSGSNSTAGVKLTDLGIVGAAAHDDISLNGSGETFVVDGPIDLSRDFYQKDDSGDYTTTANGYGTIRGDSLNVSGGSINISGGAWRNEAQSLTITSGSLTVGAVDAGTTGLSGGDSIDSWTYYKNGNPASLTWNGAFNISGATASDATVNVTGALGADSTLDLRNAQINWGSGTVTVGGNVDKSGDPLHTSATDYNATAGQGILRITGSELSDFLDLDTQDKNDTATVLNLAQGGVLLVDGNVTGPISFDKFKDERTDSPASDVGTINFDSSTTTRAGWMIANGDLTLVGGEDTNNDGTADVKTDLNINNGLLFAEGLTLNNVDPAIDATDPTTDVVKVSRGTIGVAQRLSSTNNEINFDDSTLLLDSKFGAHKDYGLSASSNGGVVSVNKLSFTEGAGFEVATGNWTVGKDGLGNIEVIDGSMEVGSGEDEYERYGYTAALTADNLYFDDGADDANKAGTDLTIYANGALTLNTIQIDNGVGIDVNGGTLTLNGRTDFTKETFESEVDSIQAIGTFEDANKQAGINLSGATINVNNGKLVLEDTAAAALVKFNVSGTGSNPTTDAVQVNEALSEATINLNNGAEFKLNFSSGTAAAIAASNGKDSIGLEAEQAKQLKDELVDTLGRGSYINVGQLALDMKYDDKTMTTTWADVKDFVQVESDVTNDIYQQLLVTGITSSDQVSGHFGALQGDLVGRNFITVDGNLGLHKAYNGYFAFVANADGTSSPLGIDLTSYSNAQFDGAGIVGDITGVGTNGDNYVYFEEGQWTPGTTNVQGSIKDIAFMHVNNDVKVDKDVEVGGAIINKSLTAQNVTFTGDEGYSVDLDSLVTGQLTVADTLTLGKNIDSSDLTVAGGEVTAGTIVLLNGSQLNVGYEAAASDNAETDFNEAANYSGRVHADILDMGTDGGVRVDPESSLPTAVASFNQFKGASTAAKDLGTATGSLYVGRNGALGLGSEGFAEIDGAIAQYQQNGSLADYGAIMYLDGYMSLAQGKGITMTAQSTADFSKYMSEHGYTLDETGGVANTVYFGANTTLKVTAEAMDAANTANKALVTINDANGKLVSDGMANLPDLF